MRTRLYIDNFRCFVKFEYKPAKRELILGANGSGKSGFIEALHLLQLFVGKAAMVGDLFPPNRRTRWLDQPKQTYELEACIGDNSYVYRLEIEVQEFPRQTRVASETVY